MRSIIRLVCAAVLAALVSPAFAEERLPDFDGRGPSVERIVAEGRAAAKSSARELKGSGVRTNGPSTPDDRVERRIVTFKKGVGFAQMSGIVQQSGGDVTKHLWLIDAVAVVLPKGRAFALDASLKRSPEVLRIEKDYPQNWLSAGAAVPSMAARGAAPINAAECPWYWPWCSEPKGQEVPWGIGRVNAQAAWPVTRGAGVKVAVVDTGVDIDHPDLAIAGGYNATAPEASYDDDHGHGTHVAGTIAAKDDDKAVVGVAPDVQLYGVKVLSASGSGTYENIIDGIQWCVANKIDIANMSLGGSSGTQALAEAVRVAVAAGLTIIAAAGNSGGSVGYPAAYPETIAIAASDAKDKTASFSSRGPEVDFIAPGVGVNSTYMGGGTKSLSGTSMACPHAAGLAALAVAGQGLRGADQVREALQRAASKIPGTPDEQQGGGMIDAGKLVGL